MTGQAKPQLSDLELLAAWGEGDRKAGNALVERHFSTVFRFFRSKVERGASDLCQRTFLACVEGRSAFRGEGSFKSYLLGIARNQLLNHYRKHRRRGDLSPAEYSISKLWAEQSTPTGRIDRGDRQSILLAALRELPIDQQITVELFYWESMATQEIADVLGVPRGTVHSRLSRARDNLREAIERLTDDPQVAEQSVKELGDWAEAIRRHLSPSAEAPESV